MGTINHDAVLVTLSGKDSCDSLQRYCEEYDLPVMVSPFVVNGYKTFCMYPDGSKEGWDESAEGDERRSEFLVKVKALNAEIVAVSYGEYGTEIKETNCFNHYD